MTKFFAWNTHRTAGHEVLTMLGSRSSKKELQKQLQALNEKNETIMKENEEYKRLNEELKGKTEDLNSKLLEKVKHNQELLEESRRKKRKITSCRIK